jgi:DNA-binding MarR family transcriptional regulator
VARTVRTTNKLVGTANCVKLRSVIMRGEASDSADLATALIRLCFVVQRIFGGVSRRYGLTPQHAQLLGVLAHGPVGMAELGEVLNLEKSSLSGLIDRAEDRALVVRVRDETDRRTCHVSLTGSGTELAVRFRDDVSRELNALAADLPESTRQRLIAAIWEILSGQDVSAIFGCASLQVADTAAVATGP